MPSYTCSQSVTVIPSSICRELFK